MAAAISEAVQRFSAKTLKAATKQSKGCYVAIKKYIRDQEDQHMKRKVSESFNSIKDVNLQLTARELIEDPLKYVGCSKRWKIQTNYGDIGLKFIRNPKLLGITSSFCSARSLSCCWSCNTQRPFLICESCGSVQPVNHSLDYFTIFGLESKFDIEDGSLEVMYKNWLKKLHPDLVHTKSKEERGYAAQQSARVIDAYTTLRKPLLRAIYLMRLEGVEVDEEQTVSEPELLGEIMEIREAVEDATDSRALNKIHSQMEEKLRHWSNSFANAFGRRNFDEALKSIQKMTYYHRVNEEIVKRL